MKWSILILTQHTRKDFLERLLSTLQPQVSSHDDVELLIDFCDYSISLGENRQRLIDSARGTYVSFVDDDDLVADDYVNSIYGALAGDAVDYVGFQLQLYIDGSPTKPTYHSLRYNRWHEDSEGYYRDITHLNPVRKDLIQYAKMSGGSGEDSRWSADVRSLGVLKIEQYIDRVMYHYYYRSNKADGA